MLSDDAFLNDKNVLPWARGARTPLYTLVMFLWGGGPTSSYLDDQSPWRMLQVLWVVWSLDRLMGKGHEQLVLY